MGSNKLYVGFDLGAKTGIAEIREAPTGELSVFSREVKAPSNHPLKHGFFYEEVLLHFRGLLQTPEDRLCGVYFEDVKRHIGTLAAHAYGAYKTLLKMACHELDIEPPIPLGVGAIKIHATGKGNASKEMMIETAVSGFLLDFVPTDNEADAIHIADLGRISK